MTTAAHIYQWLEHNSRPGSTFGSITGHDRMACALNGPFASIIEATIDGADRLYVCDEQGHHNLVRYLSATGAGFEELATHGTPKRARVVSTEQIELTNGHRMVWASGTAAAHGTAFPGRVQSNANNASIARPRIPAAA